MLAYFRATDKWVYYDSTSSSLSESARVIAQTANSLVGSTQKVQAASQVPKQTNSSDCGVYVLAFAEAILHNPAAPDFSTISPEVIIQKRIQIKETITKLI